MSSDGALRAWTVREARRGSDYIKTNLLRGEAYLQWKTSANTIDYSRDGDRDDLLLDSVVDLFEPLPGKRRLWILGGYAPLGLDLTRFLEVIEIGTGEPLAVESAFLIDGVPHSALLFQGPSRETGQPQHSLMHSFRARFDRTSSCIVFEPRPNRSESVDLMARRYRTLRLAAWRDGQFHSKSPAWGPLRLSASQCVADCRRNQ